MFNSNINNDNNKMNETHYMDVSIWKIGQRNGGGPSETIWKVIGQNFCLTFNVGQSDLFTSSGQAPQE